VSQTTHVLSRSSIDAYPSSIFHVAHNQRESMRKLRPRSETGTGDRLSWPFGRYTGFYYEYLGSWHGLMSPDILIGPVHARVNTGCFHLRYPIDVGSSPHQLWHARSYPCAGRKNAVTVLAPQFGVRLCQHCDATRGAGVCGHTAGSSRDRTPQGLRGAGDGLPAQAAFCGLGSVGPPRGLPSPPRRPVAPSRQSRVQAPALGSPSEAVLKLCESTCYSS